MKHILLSILFILNFNLHSQQLKVMTYNLRFDNPNDGENKWDLRKDFLSQQIQFYSPDIFGTQEGKLHQLEFLQSSLTNYKYLSLIHI